MIYYHWARHIDRSSIHERGLLTIHPRLGYSCAEDIDNPAGQAVYVFDHASRNEDWDGWDCWIVETDTELPKDPLSDTLGGGAFYSHDPISSEQLMCLGRYDHDLQDFV